MPWARVLSTPRARFIGYEDQPSKAFIRLSTRLLSASPTSHARNKPRHHWRGEHSTHAHTRSATRQQHMTTHMCSHTHIKTTRQPVSHLTALQLPAWHTRHACQACGGGRIKIEANVSKVSPGLRHIFGGLVMAWLRHDPLFLCGSVGWRPSGNSLSKCAGGDACFR